MRAREIIPKFKLFKAKVRIKQPGYSSLVDITVAAKNADMARKLIRQQYGKTSLISNVQELRMS
jgi:hypothetical protein